MNEIVVRNHGDNSAWWECELCHTSSKAVYKTSTVGYMVERHRATQRHQKNSRGSATVAEGASPQNDSFIEIPVRIYGATAVAVIRQLQTRIAELESKG